MIEIDASQGEGGGQVLRTVLALSVLTGHAVKLTGIRARRRNPGLAPQHLAGVKAAAQVCAAEIEGARLHSSELTFRPATPAQSGRYTFDISRLAGQGGAGAVTLLLQSILLPLALAGGPSHLILRGGTHVAWSPPVHYVQWVLFPAFARVGVQASLELVTWGWHPQGGGEVHVTIQGSAHLQSVNLLERGPLSGLRGVAAASNLPSHIPQRMAARANTLLREAGLPPRVEPLRTTGPSTGAGVFLALSFNHACAGFSALGERGRPSEVLAEEAVGPLVTYYRQTGALDPYLPDQLIPALMQASGTSSLSTVNITRHTLTNIAVVQHFVDRPVKVVGEQGRPGLIHIEGDVPALR